MLQPSESLVASASPDGGISSDGRDSAPPTLAEKRAALYDISARTVYMRDGTRLEAHSGERPFHGVEALRMKPVGPKGESNGCVSFKDYAAFVQAYKAGAVKLLIVVPSSADSVVVTVQKS